MSFWKFCWAYGGREGERSLSVCLSGRAPEPPLASPLPHSEWHALCRYVHSTGYSLIVLPAHYLFVGSSSLNYELLVDGDCGFTFLPLGASYDDKSFHVRTMRSFVV